ncbi:MAG: hypothetical protein IPL78_00870 [Chloroflexi bacterium]|nr:hypothetical protein [Chloroflexota bacterium]
MMIRRLRQWGIMLGVLLVAAACAPDVSNSQPPPLPTQLTLTPVEVVVVASPTLAPSPVPSATPEPEPTPFVPDDQTEFTVVYVSSDDVLNVRSGPGVGNGVVAELAPNATDITITGEGEMVEGSLWVPIAAGDAAGWVNSVYLTEAVTGDEFCQDEDAAALITALKSAIDSRNGPALAGLVHPYRGLIVHRHWWNPAINIPAETVADVFTDTASYYWGTEDGSGFDINGSFSEVVLPLLDNDLGLGTEIACNEILAGATAGLIRLPDGYDQINYFSVYRPAVDIEFDWGSWVVGVEKVAGQYVVSYLVHFAWEI